MPSDHPGRQQSGSTPDQSHSDPSEPRSGAASPLPPSAAVVATLARLYPFFRPAIPRFIAGMLCALAASLAALAIPQVIQWAVDNPLMDSVGTQDRSGVWLAVLLVLGLGVLEAVFIALRRAFILIPGTKVEANMRLALFRHLQNLPVAFHDQWPGGQLLSRSMSDLGMLRRWLSFGMVMLVVNTTTIAVGVGLMIYQGGWLGIAYLAGALPVVYFSYRFSSRFRRISRLSQDQAGDLATTVEESVHGIRVLKAFGRGREAYQNFSVQADELRRTELHKARTLGAFLFAITAISEVVLGACLIAGVWLAVNEQITVGALVAFFATAVVVSGPVEQLGHLVSMTLYAKTAVDRYFDVLDTSNVVDDPEHPQRPEQLRGEVVFDQVRFEYPDEPTADQAWRDPDRPREAPRRAVLDGIDLTVRPGETMAIVGLTGSGKTTLISLVPRLFDVTAGSVRIDGVDVRDMTRHDLREIVSIAFEDATLFSATVRENVLLGAPEGQDGDADLDRALTIAQAQFTRALPNGLETTIGEEGLSLSGGQRQRLALARAVAARPRVLVLDDPLSALDVATEEVVTAHLRDELAETTTVVVAHRPSTVALADRVAVLQDGVITGVGTHTELLATHEHYRFVISSLVEDEDERDEAEPMDPSVEVRS
ncbi:ABC transporter ATP-binding protein [Ruania halotolerans]|uniref:ABC transporter ATP-binding protein n=1 Tax=Ruania halotolerans TaxID=2897773 RepID=UPI001E494C85|nr:ABC transporter ATP-binding protein [Ruania halotolerans]UFU04981.1 ABC transporter ATP-binding protein/permease [Ruania halotolerans]